MTENPQNPDLVPKSPEGSMPEVFRAERYELYTVEGDIRITALKEAMESGDIKRIQREVEESLGYMEGLYWGLDAKDYGVYDDAARDEREINDLKGSFENLEDSKNRPHFQYVQSALINTIVNAAREASVYRRDSSLWRFQYAQGRRFYHMANLENQVLAGRKNFRSNEEKEAEIQRLVYLDLSIEEPKVKKWSESVEDLRGLKDHIDAREQFESAFMEAQSTCEDEDRWFKYNEGMTKPDKAHWIGAYRANRVRGETESEWGRVASTVEDKIEDIRWGRLKLEGMQDGHNVYVNGWRTTGEFVSWIKALLPYAKINGTERMDVIFFAWKQSLAKGRISRLSWAATPMEAKDGELKGKDGNRVDEQGNIIYTYKFGPPPFASDIRTKLIHNEKVRASEFGWCANNAKGEIVDLDEWKLITLDTNGVMVGSRDMTERDFQEYVAYAEKHRIKPYRAISHSGHPLSIGRVGRLGNDYESRTELKKWKNPRDGMEYKNVRLIDISTKFGISRSDPQFPWSDTEIRSGDEPQGEPLAGSWGSWHLDTIRGYVNRKEHIRSVPSPKELTIEFFESSKIRAYEKLRLLRPGPLVDEVPKNPFAWLLAGWMRARTRTLVKKGVAFLEGDRGYRSRSLNNKTVVEQLGQTRAGDVADLDILDDALRTGCISQSESDWIQKNITADI